MPHNFGDLQKVHFWGLPKVGWMTKQRSQQPDRTRQYWPRDPVHGFTFAVWDIQQALRILRSPIPRLEECPPGLDTCVLQREMWQFQSWHGASVDWSSDALNVSGCQSFMGARSRIFTRAVPGTGSLLIRAKYASLCGSDFPFFRNLAERQRFHCSVRYEMCLKGHELGHV